MLDPYLRRLIDPTLNVIGKYLHALGVTANIMTLTGFLFGLLSIFSILYHEYYLAAAFIALNRISDGLDGAIARQNSVSDFGGFLDIVCDFIIYAGVVFAFGVANPDSLIYASFLIFSFIGPISSFLGYAIIASKRQVTTQSRGIKSFYYLGGICEGTETATVLILFCLLPQYFDSICLVYGFLCWLTTLGRIYSAWNDFGKPCEIINLDYFSSACKEQAEEIKSQVR